MEGCMGSHSCYPLVQSIDSFKRLGERFVWKHVLREGNQVVNNLVATLILRSLSLFYVIFVDVTLTIFPRDF
uniref:Uncharacterized protein n=1 Tax=Glycine max TaxID=3847 RepID=A0A0R0J888_SOYBN